MLGPLLFLIYINDLQDGIISLCKIFADDTSLFSKLHNVSKYVNDLNAEKISQCNPDPNKQANEIIFSCKSHSTNVFHLPLKFNNNNSIATFPSQKHLGIMLDSKLNFSYHLMKMFKNVTN